MAIVKLTQQFIDNQLVCPQGSQRTEFVSDERSGLYVEVRSSSNGQGTYYLRYKDQSGKSCHQKIGRTVEISLADARRKVKELKAEIELGADPRAEERTRKAVITFDDFFKEHYLPYVKPRKRSWNRDEELYRLRWDVENYFRDLVNNLPLEQWHSKTENGILQELYVRLWIMNYARIQQFLNEKPIKNPLSRIYKRSNFKLILDFIINHWADFFARKRKFLQKIKLLIKASTEKRKRYSRSVKRQLRYQNKNYPAANIIFDPEVKVA